MASHIYSMNIQDFYKSLGKVNRFFIHDHDKKEIHCPTIDRLISQNWSSQ